MQAPAVQTLFSMVQSKSTEHRSPNNAVYTCTVAGVGLYPGIWKPPEKHNCFHFRDLKGEKLIINIIYLI